MRKPADLSPPRPRPVQSAVNFIGMQPANRCQASLRFALDPAARREANTDSAIQSGGSDRPPFFRSRVSPRIARTAGPCTRPRRPAPPSQSREGPNTADVNTTPFIHTIRKRHRLSTEAANTRTPHNRRADRRLTLAARFPSGKCGLDNGGGNGSSFIAVPDDTRTDTGRARAALTKGPNKRAYETCSATVIQGRSIDAKHPEWRFWGGNGRGEWLRRTTDRSCWKMRQ